MQKIFIVGDSISIQYGPYLEKMLEGKFELSRKDGREKALQNLDIPEGANGGDSSMVLSYLKYMMRLEHFHPDILILNCGLHDIKTNPSSGSRQVPEKNYRENLQEIARVAAEKKMSCIWIRSTPVVDKIHNGGKMDFHRFNRDLVAYNQIADEIFSTAGWKIIDLCGFTEKFGPEAYCDHVHFIEKVRELQAAYIAGFLSCVSA